MQKIRFHLINFHFPLAAFIWKYRKFQQVFFFFIFRIKLKKHTLNTYTHWSIFVSLKKGGAIGGSRCFHQSSCTVRFALNAIHTRLNDSNEMDVYELTNNKWMIRQKTGSKTDVSLCQIRSLVLSSGCCVKSQTENIILSAITGMTRTYYCVLIWFWVFLLCFCNFSFEIES